MQQMDKQYHIHCAPGDVGAYCILPGDPGRCSIIASYLDEAHFVAQNREYTVYTGKLDGVPVSVCSSGIGGPSAAIALEELAACGTHTFIRIGTCGGIATDVQAGDLVIAMSAVRQDGTSYEYAPVGYPATASFDVVWALDVAARYLGARRHVGVVQAKDSFYGQHMPERMPVSSMLMEKWEAYKQLGVLASEMESAALFVAAAARGLRCGSVFSVIWNQEREKAGLDQNSCFDVSLPIRCSVDAMRILIAQDHAKSRRIMPAPSSEEQSP